jgi:hypothetical protein
VDKPMHLDKYFKYLDKHPNITAIKQFKCGATRGQRPRFHNTVPGGDCFLYPEFLIFLTNSKKGVGWRSTFTNIVDFFAADIALMKWANNPATILFDIAKSMNSYIDPEKLEELLANPNSIFVPLRSLTGVEAERDWTQGNYIIIHTKDGDVSIVEHISEYPNPIRDLMKGKKPTFVTPKFLYNKMRGHIVGEWQPDVVVALGAAVKKYRTDQK